MIARLIEERYVRPHNDLLTVIAKGRDDFDLSEREMLSLVPGLFLAGRGTLAHELTNTLWRLLSVPRALGVVGRRTRSLRTEVLRRGSAL